MFFTTTYGFKYQVDSEKPMFTREILKTRKFNPKRPKAKVHKPLKGKGSHKRVKKESFLDSLIKLLNG